MHKEFSLSNGEDWTVPDGGGDLALGQVAGAAAGGGAGQVGLAILHCLQKPRVQDTKGLHFLYQLTIFSGFCLLDNGW